MFYAVFAAAAASIHISLEESKVQMRRERCSIGITGGSAKIRPTKTPIPITVTIIPVRLSAIEQRPRHLAVFSSPLSDAQLEMALNTMATKPATLG